MKKRRRIKTSPEQRKRKTEEIQKYLDMLEQLNDKEKVNR